MDGQTNRPNQFAPSTSAKFGALQCINVKMLWPSQAQFITILSFDFQV